MKTKELLSMVVIVCCISNLYFLIEQTYSEGYINNMKRFHLSSDAELHDAIVVRVYGSNLDTFVDRQKEVLAMQVQSNNYALNLKAFPVPLNKILIIAFDIIYET